MRPGFIQLRVLDMGTALRHYRDAMGLKVVSEEKDGRVYLRAYDGFDRHSIVLRPTDKTDPADESRASTRIPRRGRGRRRARGLHQRAWRRARALLSGRGMGIARPEKSVHIGVAVRAGHRGRAGRVDAAERVGAESCPGVNDDGPLRLVAIQGRCDHAKAQRVKRDHLASLQTLHTDRRRAPVKDRRGHRDRRRRSAPRAGRACSHRNRRAQQPRAGDPPPGGAQYFLRKVETLASRVPFCAAHSEMDSRVCASVRGPPT